MNEHVCLRDVKHTHIFLHVLVSNKETLSDGVHDILIVARPKLFLFRNVMEEIIASVFRGALSAVSIEYAKVKIVDMSFNVGYCYVITRFALEADIVEVCNLNNDS